MPLDATTREIARQRAELRCEYCGASETDAGGELTIDHYRPQSKGGSDDLANLLYCCIRCNQYKGDYWPSDSEALSLWNPRREPAASHFTELTDGVLQSLTATGELTLRLLHLNRPQLIAYRRSQNQAARTNRQLARYEKLFERIAITISRQTELSDEHLELLQEMQKLLNDFFNETGND